MEEIGFLVITFDSEVQMTSGFDCCASYDDIFHRTPIMTMMLHNWGGAKWPKMAQNYHLGPIWAFWPHPNCVTPGSLWVSYERSHQN